jgi:mannose-6-phosphate isomerase-like protein (cupin superfamily)
MPLPATGKARTIVSDTGEDPEMTGRTVNIFQHRGRFFEILQQTERSQTAVMTVGPGQDAGPEETHRGDQIIFVVEGEALVRVAGKEHKAAVGSLLMIPAGTPHHVRNTGKTPLFFLTVYAPPAY